jgi:hypothetical protein
LGKGDGARSGAGLEGGLPPERSAIFGVGCCPVRPLYR